MKNKIGFVVTGFALLGSLLMAAPAFAQTTTAPPQGGWGEGHMMGRAPGVFGSVTAVSGNTLTVQSRSFGQNTTATTYTVDATNAAVTKNGSASSVGSVAVGDMVMVQGTVSGTSVTATAIHDGMPQGGLRGGMGRFASSTMTFRHPATSTLPQGNGQPVVGGKVTAVSGNTITITNASNVTYTIDATNAVVTAKGQTSSVGTIAVGDNLLVQGAVNGSAVTASSVIDQGAAPADTNSNAGGAPQNHGFMGGIMGGVGSFFHKLFGFF
jgi:hypothetical protein